MPLRIGETLSEFSLPEGVRAALEVRATKHVELHGLYRKALTGDTTLSRSMDGTPISDEQKYEAYLNGCRQLDDEYEAKAGAMRQAFLVNSSGQSLPSWLEPGYRSLLNSPAGGYSPLPTVPTEIVRPRNRVPATRSEKMKDMKRGFGCMGIVAAIILVVVLISLLSGGGKSVPQPEFTEANGMDTCKAMISSQPDGHGEQNVRGSVLFGDLYKAKIETIGAFKVYTWTCRLEWTGSAWRTDILTHKQSAGKL